MVTTHTYDALVVGAGGAGMRAAIELSDTVKTAVVSKLYPTRSHTGAAQGGVCAALGNTEEDSPEWHAFDTVKGGASLTDQPAAPLMARESAAPYGTEGSREAYVRRWNFEHWPDTHENMLRCRREAIAEILELSRLGRPPSGPHDTADAILNQVRDEFGARLLQYLPPAGGDPG